MGWRGALRSIAAAQRRAERESARQYRELQKQHAQLQKLEEGAHAAYEVECYNNLIARLTSIQAECGDTVDWHSIHDSSPPNEPTISHPREQAAQRQLDAFEPSWLDKLLRRGERKRDALTRALAEAHADDAAGNERARSRYISEIEEWKERRDLARRVLDLEPAALSDAVQELDPFSELQLLGSHVQMNFHSEGLAEVTLHVNGDDVVPKESKSLLKSGKVSVKRMATGQFWEIYQDYVAGAVLRVGRELCAAVPVRLVFITAVAVLLNSASGHLEEQPILSVKIPRDTLARLKFAALDPSDALSNFVHVAEFRRTKGLSPVRRLALTE